MFPFIILGFLSAFIKRGFEVGVAVFKTIEKHALDQIK